MLLERHVRVAEEPPVDLFVAHTPGEHAETLLVIHGGPDWDQTYLHDPLVRLGDERRVVFADLRGCGRSTRGLPPDAYTPESATRDLVALLTFLGEEPVDVLGFSYGGLIAQRLALAAPERVRRLVVASSSVLPVPPDAFAGWAERDERIASQPPVENRNGGWDAHRTRLEAIRSARVDLWRRDRLSDYLARLDRVSFSAEWAGPWVAGKLPEPRLPEGVERLARLGMPVLLLQGRRDMTFPVSLVEPTLQMVPTAVAAVIEDAGHMTHIDQPEAWLDALRNFLRSDERRRE